MALTDLDVVSVPVADQDRAKDFYTGVLGFAELADNPFGDGTRWVMLCPPGATTKITLTTWFPTMPPGSLKGLVLMCDGLEATMADLERRGLAFNETEIQRSPWGRWKTFDDPDGNGWVLQESVS